MTQKMVPVAQTFMIKALRDVSTGHDCVVVGTLIQRVVDDPRIEVDMNGFYAIKLLEGQDVYRSEERRKGTPVYAEAMVCGGARARN